jgi:hypothetical protein
VPSVTDEIRARTRNHFPFWHTLFLIVNTLFLIVTEMTHVLLRGSMNAATQDIIEAATFCDPSVEFLSQLQ